MLKSAKEPSKAQLLLMFNGYNFNGWYDYFDFDNLINEITKLTIKYKPIYRK